MNTPTPVSATGTPYGTIPPASPMPQRKPISLPRLAQMREAGEKITMITAYDATYAAVADAAGIECILVGDSLGMVCQGLHSTVGVSLDTMAYHTESVARGLHRAQGTAWLVSDLPYGSYAESKEQALRSASRLMQAGALDDLRIQFHAGFQVGHAIQHLFQGKSKHVVVRRVEILSVRLV